MLTKHRGSLSFESLTGRQKAAIVLMAMGPEAAAEITKSLNAEEMEEISFEIARMDRVPPEIVTATLSEWGQMETAALSIAEGGVDYARRVLEQSLGTQKAAGILKRIETQLKESSGFRNLRQADPAQVTGLLRNEHPQTIALLLAHLEPDQTASILKELPPETGSEVLWRLARLGRVLPEVLMVLERTYGTDSTVTISKDMEVAGGPDAVAGVLNRLTASFEKSLMDGIAEKDPDLCEQIKNLMFVFEDIVRLDERSIQRLLRDVQMKELALALKTASEDLKQKILPLMSSRAADSLREEMEFLGAVRLRDVEVAQTNIVKLVRALEATGEVVISGGDDEMVL
jgi:flagellar motor switch protein FliG